MNNIHATAIVLGTTGILITGPSGCGKSELALSLLCAASQHGLFSILIADDQVLLSEKNDQIIAETPEAIAGMLEIRGTGIVYMDYLKNAVIDFALRPISLNGANRLPPSDSMTSLENGIELPLVTCTWPAVDPFSKLLVLCPELGKGLPARPSLV